MGVKEHETITKESIMKTAFIAFAMAVAVSSAFATYCEPHRFICTDPWGDDLVSEEENAVGIIMPWKGSVAGPLAFDFIFPSVKDGNDVLLTGGQVAFFDLARPKYAPRSEQGGGVDLALPAYPPFDAGVADIRGFGGWDLA